MSSSLVAALRAAEQMRTTVVTAVDVFDRLNAALERSVDDLWVSPMTVEYADEFWPMCDIEPRHPYRRDGNRWTAREYRAMCRRWRREHRAWRRRQPAPPIPMVQIRAEARALTRDGTVQKFGYVQVIPKRLVVEEPALVELIVKNISHKMRAALVRHWEEA